MAKDFDYYFAQLRKIEDHREKKSEAEIRKLYKKLLKDTKQFVSDEYFQLAEDGKLTYEILRTHARDARFLEEVEQRLGGISQDVSDEIKQTVRDMYQTAYEGIYKAVEKGEMMTFTSLGSATADMIENVVNNPIATVALEKNYRDVIYTIRQQIATGLVVGDRYDTMAKRIAKALDISYKRSVRIVRTETGRAREAGHFDCAKGINEELKDGLTEKRMYKTWRTMQDGAVRDTHGSMEGVTIPVDDLFHLPSGATAMAPKQSGEASEDINCRCYASYKLMTEAEYRKMQN